MQKLRNHHEQSESSPEPALYEQLYQTLYTYHFGAISFLELIEQFEIALNLVSAEQGKAVDEQIITLQAEDK